MQPRDRRLSTASDCLQPLRLFLASFDQSHNGVAESGAIVRRLVDLATGDGAVQTWVLARGQAWRATG